MITKFYVLIGQKRTLFRIPQKYIVEPIGNDAAGVHEVFDRLQNCLEVVFFWLASHYKIDRRVNLFNDQMNKE
jgi:hypothetical protein